MFDFLLLHFHVFLQEVLFLMRSDAAPEVFLATEDSGTRALKPLRAGLTKDTISTHV